MLYLGFVNLSIASERQLTIFGALGFVFELSGIYIGKFRVKMDKRVSNEALSDEAVNVRDCREVSIFIRQAMKERE